MKKLGEKISSKVIEWVGKQAHMYAGMRCVRHYHQPKVPKALLKEKD